LVDLPRSLRKWGGTMVTEMVFYVLTALSLAAVMWFAVNALIA
jgi:hypothetical protein